MKYHHRLSHDFAFLRQQYDLKKKVFCVKISYDPFSKNNLLNFKVIIKWNILENIFFKLSFNI